MIVRLIDKKGFQSSTARRMGIRFLSGLIHVCCKTKVYDVTSGYRAISREYIQMYAEDYPDDYPEPEAIIMASLNGARIKEVPVEMKARTTGRSSIYSWKSAYYMIKVSLAIVLRRISTKKRKKRK